MEDCMRDYSPKLNFDLALSLLASSSLEESFFWLENKMSLLLHQWARSSAQSSSTHPWYDTMAGIILEPNDHLILLEVDLHYALLILALFYRDRVV